MLTQEQMTKLKNDVQNIIDELLEIEPEKLVRNELGIELNFSLGLVSFYKTHKLLKELKLVNIDELSHQQLSSIGTQLTTIKTTYKNVLEFSIAKHPNNSSQERNAILDSVVNQTNNLFSLLSPLILYYRKIDDHVVSANNIVNKLKETSDDALNKINDYQKQIQETLENVRNAAAEVGVAQHAIHFAKTAEDHQKYATRWLVATIIMGAATILITGYFTHGIYIIIKGNITEDPSKAVNAIYLIQYGVAKLVLLSILYFSILWSNKNYKAHRHCNVVNKHRQNALSTFEAFVKSTDDSQTKNAVLIQASSCIFTPQHTGYLTFEPESGTNPTILEIVRGAVEKK